MKWSGYAQHVVLVDASVECRKRMRTSLQLGAPAFEKQILCRFSVFETVKLQLGLV